MTCWTVFNVAADVEKLREKYSVRESRLRKLISEVEQLNIEQQKLQQQLNAGVVSVSLLSADVNRLTDEISVDLLCVLSAFDVLHMGKQRNFSCFEFEIKLRLVGGVA